jgi:N-methylhydantoinase B
MTNTANTPIEALEAEYPLRVLRLGLRPRTGGDGMNPGGDGTVKEVEVLEDDAVLTLLSDRRRTPPRGVSGGDAGLPGANTIIRQETEHPLPSKCTLSLMRGDVLRIKTPGGGGWGEPTA